MSNEKNKCNKYESFFIFGNEEAFQQHLNECSECKEEYENQLKISALIKEVAPIYLKQEQEKNKNSLKKLACCFIAFVGLISFSGYKFYNDNLINYSEDSCISSLGLPVDDYGLLEI